MIFVCGLPAWVLVRAWFKWAEARKDNDLGQLMQDVANLRKDLKGSKSDTGEKVQGGDRDDCRRARRRRYCFTSIGRIDLPDVSYERGGEETVLLYGL